MKTGGSIAFICSGNICRSAMAEVLARRFLEESGVKAEVSSVGVLGLIGYPAAREAIEAVSILGLELSDHRSRDVSRPYLQQADAIVVMAEEHARVSVAIDAGCSSRIFRLWQYTDDPDRLEAIPDPLGQKLDVFIACRDELIECLRNWIPLYLDRF